MKVHQRKKLDFPELSEEAGESQRAAQEQIQRLLARLSARERAILTLRFFLCLASIVMLSLCPEHCEWCLRFRLPQDEDRSMVLKVYTILAGSAGG